MASNIRVFMLLFVCSFLILGDRTNGEIPTEVLKAIAEANREGPYLGLVTPNEFVLNPLLRHPSYRPSNLVIDVAGRRFRFGTIAGEKVVVVTSGLAMLNAGITTQLLLSLFNVKGVVHYGLAGSANSYLHLGDVTIPRHWAHTGLWSWQRYGMGPEDELPLEASGDYTREIGYLKFADYATNVSESPNHDNLLNNVWYQREEIFPVDGTPEKREHVFWVPVNPYYFELSQKLEDMILASCIPRTCIRPRPKVRIVSKGGSANIYVDNAAYRNFLHGKFEVSPVDMESAAVALICHQQRVPFITIRALSNLAGGVEIVPYEGSNEADTLIARLAATNSVAVVVEFIKLLGGNPVPI